MSLKLVLAWLVCFTFSKKIGIQGIRRYVTLYVYAVYIKCTYIF